MAQPGTAPESIVVTLLAATAVGTAGTDIFNHPSLPKDATIPWACVFVTVVGGPPPQTYVGNTADLRFYTVQVRTRGNVGGYQVALVKARLAWVTLQRGTPGVTGYFAIKVREPDPVFIGNDDTEHPEFVNNVELWYKG